jgi:DNA-binding MarR family transcriptional regulator
MRTITKETPLYKEVCSLFEARRLWQSAQRWRHTVDRELSTISLTFVQWHTLEVISTLISETNDAISQIDIVRRSELDRTTVSKTMQIFDDLGLISREPGYQYLAYRIWLSEKGLQTLELARSILLHVPSPTRITQSE